MLDHYLEVAKEAARAGGAVLMSFFGKPLEIWKKGAIDLVTEADLAAEEKIMEVIGRAFPRHDILTEESRDQTRDGEFIWVIDPLDGTTNFAHGYPVFAVSIALRHQGEEKVGVVYAPFKEEMFWARTGGGAFLNNRVLRVSTINRLIEALLVTGFPYDIHQSQDNSLNLFCRFILNAQAVRRDGSAALDLCYVAAGRFEGFWERRLKPWDTAAAALIIREAGGMVSRFDGGPYDIFDPEILASNGLIHRTMMDLIKKDQ